MILCYISTTMNQQNSHHRNAPVAGRLLFLAAIWLLVTRTVCDESVNSTAASRRKIQIDRKRVIFQPFQIHLFPQCQSFSRTDMNKFFKTVRQTISASIQPQADTLSQGLEFRYTGLTKIEEVSIDDDCHATLEVGMGSVNFFVSADGELPSESQVAEWVQDAVQDNLLKALQRTKELKYISRAGLGAAPKDMGMEQKDSSTVKKSCTADDSDGASLSVSTVPVCAATTVSASNETELTCATSA